MRELVTADKPYGGDRLFRGSIALADPSHDKLN